MSKIRSWLVVLAVIAGVVLLWLIRPQGLTGSDLQAPDTVAAPAPVNRAPDCQEAFFLDPIFTSAVVDRLPQDQLLTADPARGPLWFYTLAVAGRGQSAHLKWFRDDQVVAQETWQLEADRQPLWSQQTLAGDAGSMRVQIAVGDCPAVSTSVPISAPEQVVSTTVGGWMRPARAVLVMLARQAAAHAKPGDTGRSYVDNLTETGETYLLQAIRNGDSQRALQLIRSVEVPASEQFTMPVADQARLLRMAHPFTRDAQLESPLDAAHRLGLDEVVEALLESATTGGPGGARDRGDWGDDTLASLVSGAGGDLRFSDGDTALLRAVRTGNERAVLTLLRLNGSQSQHNRLNAISDLYAFDASGRQAPDIAREAGYYGVGRLLDLAARQFAPGWAVLRSAFTTRLENNAPSDCRKSAFADEIELHFFAEVRHLEGREVSHEWLFDDDVVQRQNFSVAADRQVTVSSRQFSSQDIGQWRLRIVTATGIVLHSTQLSYRAVTDGNKKNRARFNAPCSLGGSALYTMMTALAPLAELEYLLSVGVEVQPKGMSRGKDLFFRAVNYGGITQARWLLEQGLDIDDSISASHKTALMVAAENNDRAMLGFLLRRGAKLERAHYRDKRTVLHMAALNAHDQAVADLLDANADPLVADNQGNTALHLAVSRCYFRVSRLLLQRGADPGAANRNGDTPRSQATACEGREGWDSAQLQGLDGG